MVTKRRTALHLITCPKCGQVGTMQRIIYGLPDDDFDFEKYAVGGCCITGDGSDPDICCKGCGWRGLRDVEEKK